MGDYSVPRGKPDLCRTSPFWQIHRPICFFFFFKSTGRVDHFCFSFVRLLSSVFAVAFNAKRKFCQEQWSFSGLFCCLSWSLDELEVVNCAQISLWSCVNGGEILIILSGDISVNGAPLRFIETEQVLCKYHSQSSRQVEQTTRLPAVQLQMGWSCYRLAANVNALLSHSSLSQVHFIPSLRGFHSASPWCLLFISIPAHTYGSYGLCTTFFQEGILCRHWIFVHPVFRAGR